MLQVMSQIASFGLMGKQVGSQQGRENRPDFREIMENKLPLKNILVLVFLFALE